MRISMLPVGKMLVVLLFATLSLNLACAEGSKMVSNKSTALTQSYVWYDGDREQRVWLNPQVVAEFNPGSEGERAMQSVKLGARIVSTKHAQAGIRFWQLNDSAGISIRSITTAHPHGKYSAVMHDTPTSDGPIRALPGNIIVYLDPLWSQTAVHSWLRASKLELVKKLDFGPNIYVIKTGPGLEALETANSLYRSGKVKAAFPDWWQEIATR